MRSILLAAVLVASTLVPTVRPAEACGGSYELVLIAHPIVRPRVAPENARAFALRWDRLDAKRAKNVTLERLDTKSFDRTTSAPKERLSTPARLTLLGPSGAKLVELRDAVWLDLAFDQEEAREALPLPKGDFVIALEGHFKDATWTSFQVTHGSTVTSFRGGGMHVTLAHGTGSFNAGGTSFEGYPLGMITVRGAKYIVVHGTRSLADTWLARI